MARWTTSYPVVNHPAVGATGIPAQHILLLLTLTNFLSQEQQNQDKGDPRRCQPVPSPRFQGSSGRAGSEYQQDIPKCEASSRGSGKRLQNIQGERFLFFEFDADFYCQVKSESLPHSLLPTDYPESLLSSTTVKEELPPSLLPPGFKIKEEEVDPALLPPGYKIKQEEVDPSLLPPGFKVKQEEIDASLLPPGYKIKEEKIDDSLLPPGFKVQQEEIDPALLPPGFKVKQEEVDPALLPPGYDPKSVKIEPAPLDPSLLPKGYNPDAIKVKTPPASLLPKGFDPNAAPPTPPPSAKPTLKQIKLAFPG